MFSVGLVLVLSILLLQTFRVVHSSGAAPTWFNPSSPESKTIPENTGSGFSIYVAIATDNEGDTLTYSLAQTPSSPSFSFDSDSGILRTPAGLDAETSTSYTLVFSVTDTTSTVQSPALTINIEDLNEFSPVFNQTAYSATISETAVNGDKVVTVYASDDDVTDSVTYTITVGDSITFSIGPTSGELTVATASNLNAASTPSYTITVQASDGTNTVTATVSVTVLDDPCSPNPCQNLGTCDSSVTPYTCSCQPGWIGTTCSTDDPCWPSPCENSGTCSVVDSSYNCSCVAGWLGDNCTIDDPCLPEPCKNSGACSVSGTSYQCNCTSGFSGTDCSETSNADSEDGFPAGAIVGICLSLILLCCVVAVIILFKTKYFRFHREWMEKEHKFYMPKPEYYKRRPSSSLKSNSVNPISTSIVNFQSETKMIDKQGTRGLYSYDANKEKG